MKNKIIEIIEIGFPKSQIQREGEPVSELIDTFDMQDEINKQLNPPKMLYPNCKKPWSGSECEECGFDGYFNPNALCND